MSSRPTHQLTKFDKETTVPAPPLSQRIFRVRVSVTLITSFNQRSDDQAFLCKIKLNKQKWKIQIMDFATWCSKPKTLSHGSPQWKYLSWNGKSHKLSLTAFQRQALNLSAPSLENSTPSSSRNFPKRTPLKLVLSTSILFAKLETTILLYQNKKLWEGWAIFHKRQSKTSSDDDKKCRGSLKLEIPSILNFLDTHFCG